MNKGKMCAVVVTMICGAYTILMAQPKDNAVSDEVVSKITEAAPEKASVNPKQARKILIFSLCQGFKHGCIPTAQKCFEILGQKSGAYQADTSSDMSVFTKENLSQYDAILFNNTTGLKFEDPAQREAFMDFIKSGKGFIGIHAASDNFNNFPEAAEMIGGTFDGHPWGAGGTWAVKIDDPNSPINKAFGGEGFKIKDEIYQVKGPYSRDTHHILLSLDLNDEATGAKEGKRQDKDYAVAWIKSCGNGRVFYCSLGHNNEVYWNKAVLQHYLDGIQWAVGDLEADARPSNKK